MADSLGMTQTVASVISTVTALVTLLTVYIGAMQLLSENRIHRLGLSWRFIGLWKTVVDQSRLMGLQRRIFAPSVTVEHLLDTKWQFNIAFPRGLSLDDEHNRRPRQWRKSKRPDVEQVVASNDNDLNRAQAKTSWVNFMEALGMSPDDRQHYEVQYASEFINGVVPMRWKGQDLASICSILGFQSFEEFPDARTPMILPMQWSSPLGWLQFQAHGTNGCVVQFRRRMDLKNQITVSKKHWPEEDGGAADACQISSHDVLRGRLWNSINGFALPKNSALYLGGIDCDRPPNQFDDEEGPAAQTPEDLIKCAAAHAMGDEEIKRMLFGTKAHQPRALRHEQARNERDGGDGNIPDFLRALSKHRRDDGRNSNMMHVLRKCSGLLSTATHGELASNRGLSIYSAKEYHRRLVAKEDVDTVRFPNRLGKLCMDDTLLGLLKEAVLMLQPDGFYFSPTFVLHRDLCEIYGHVEDCSNRYDHVFSETFIGQFERAFRPEASEIRPPRRSLTWDHLRQSSMAVIQATMVSLLFSQPSIPDPRIPDPSPRPTSDQAVPGAVPGHTPQDPSDSPAQTPYIAYHILGDAMRLCNELQEKRNKGRAQYTVADMKFLARVSRRLRGLLCETSGSKSRDLIWAMLYCPHLVDWYLRGISSKRCHAAGSLKANSIEYHGTHNDIDEDACSLESFILVCFQNNENEMKCTPILNVDEPRGFSSKFVAHDAEFNRLEVLAAITYVFITFYWIDKRWISDVALYDMTMPQLVYMC